ncbi:hypothetical protein SDC9_07180 [bioreactor metagenome]|jgi:hypothetical protein|nr:MULTISPECIES: hypothetical protein [Dehalococcoides]AGG08452.1 putative membrane protein [Dehalococcoides mccartyi BTF08]AMU87164.1 putative membrane protein [Dehalococcoides mccartyi]MBA2084374.1 hypothetical protein [Dehalococcoides mccartyi]POZ59473.1 hypothetical protein C1O63_0468 [Dehalococcoides mccartyi]WRX71664.1 hypothetical protein [Dehalococcoides mccartyi]
MLGDDFNRDGFRIFCDSLNSEINLLFQRLNYFLVASSFLVTAFATILVAANGCIDGGQLVLAFMINAVGLYLSLFFVVINYLNTRIIWQKGKYLRDTENTPEVIYRINPNSKSEEIVLQKVWGEELNHSQFKLILNMIKEAWDFFFGPGKASKSGLVPHTYLIPLGFGVFWAVLFVMIINGCLNCVSKFIFISPLLLYIIIWLLIKFALRLKERCKKSKNRVRIIGFRCLYCNSEQGLNHDLGCPNCGGRDAAAITEISRETN